MVVPVRVDPAGVTGPTPGRAAGPDWRRTTPEFYVPTATGRAADQRIVEAAQALPGYGGVTGWAALWWLGGLWFTGTRHAGDAQRDVTLATMIHARAHPGVTFSEERLGPRELTMADGLPITNAVRSVCFEARYAPSLVAAVRVFDLAAYSDLVSWEECGDYLSHLNGWTGVPQARAAHLLSSENAWSPMEVDMRLVWCREGGHDMPVCNAPVFDLEGRFIATPDLIDPVAGVVGEYDGAHHLAPAQRFLDVKRESELRAVGLEVVTMLAADNRDPAHFVQRLRESFARAAARPVSQRRWTLERPTWWIPTDTVAQRRALSDGDRARFLGRRLGPFAA